MLYEDMMIICYLCISWQAAQGGGHRTLLYGHAILLRHSFSGMVSINNTLLSVSYICTHDIYLSEQLKTPEGLNLQLDETNITSHQPNVKI